MNEDLSRTQMLVTVPRRTQNDARHATRAALEHDLHVSDAEVGQHALGIDYRMSLLGIPKKMFESSSIIKLLGIKCIDIVS